MSIATADPTRQKLGFVSLNEAEVAVRTKRSEAPDIKFLLDHTNPPIILSPEQRRKYAISVRVEGQEQY